jgi:hypothetical protein
MDYQGTVLFRDIGLFVLRYNKEMFVMTFQTITAEREEKQHLF